jgi:hypothetical protein
MTAPRIVRRRLMPRLGLCPVCKLTFRVGSNGAVLRHGGALGCRGSGRLPLRSWLRTVLDSIRTVEDWLSLPWSQRLEPQPSEETQ